MEHEKKYDAIIIGSGIGSLTVASLLAKCLKLRVLVLEQHYTLGGQTHAFHRKGKLEFDVGLHYIGSMDRGESKNIFDFITDRKVKWQKMPDDFEKFSYPDFEFNVPSNKATYRKRLIEMFPQEQEAIERYFKDIKTAGKWYIAAMLEDSMPFILRSIFRMLFRIKAKIANITTDEYLNQNFKDPKLKALLVSQWGDYGLRPKESSFGMHALIVAHYLRGAWYPEGGAKTIAQAIVPIIESHGGRVLKRKTVSKVLIKNNQAYGVSAHGSFLLNKEEEEYYAPLIISGVGAVQTYLNLIPEQIKIPFRHELVNPKGYSALVIYLGLKESPEVLGIKGENHWVFDSIFHNDSEDEEGFLSGYYLSFPSLKNKLAEGHTADIITFINYDRFDKWKDGAWKKRGEEYENFKTKIAQKLITKVNQRIPGFADIVNYIDVSTPLTMKHFLNCEKGLFYGMPMTPSRLFKAWTHAKTPVKNLYLTGTDVMTPGVIGAMMGGVKTAGAILGPFGFFRIIKETKKI